MYVTDIYVACVSYTHQVAAKGFFIALVSTTVETANPEAELKPGLDLLGPIKEKYVSVVDVMLRSRLFIKCISNIVLL
jgi:Rab GDP dissociation inhibitor